MIVGPRCTKCGSSDTEALMTITTTQTNECLACGSVWISSPQAEAVFKDPHRHWAYTGEET